MNKSQREALLSGLNLLSPKKEKPKARRAKSPRTPRPQFLPGEKRANVGPAGFQEMDIARYKRRLYANSEPRNLTPPQFLSPSGGSSSERKTEHVPVGSDPHYPEVWRKEKANLKSACLSEEYREKFLLSLLTASYRVWTIGPWVWKENSSKPLITKV